MTSQEQIDAILKQTKLINKRKEAVYEELMARVAEQGIRILRFNELDEDGARYLEGYFKSEIAPLIFAYCYRKETAISVFEKQRDLCGSGTRCKREKRPSRNHSMHKQYFRTSDRSTGYAWHIYAC